MAGLYTGRGRAAQIPQRGTESAVAPPSPDSIMQVLGSHMAAKYLLVATQVGPFDALGQGPQPPDALARRVDLPPRRCASWPTHS